MHGLESVAICGDIQYFTIYGTFELFVDFKQTFKLEFENNYCDKPFKTKVIKTMTSSYKLIQLAEGQTLKINVTFRLSTVQLYTHITWCFSTQNGCHLAPVPALNPKESI